MQFLIVTAVLVAAGVIALFTIGNNTPMFIATLVVVVVGFIFGVSRIAAEKDKE